MGMDGINAHSNVLGSGGYGGWGSGCGIAPVGLFGLIGGDWGRRHHESDGGNGRLIELFNDSVNEKFAMVNANIDRGQLQDTIRDAKQTLHDDAQHARTAHEVFALGVTRDFGDVKTGLRDLAFQNALGNKDLTSAMKDCCCDVKSAIKDEGDKTRALINQLDREALLLRNGELRGELSNCKQTHHLEHTMVALANRLDRMADNVSRIGSIVTGTGNLVGNNTNTGTQVGG